MNKKHILLVAALLLGGCYAQTKEDKYTSETARAIIDGANNICCTIFIGALMRALCNK